MSIVLHTKITKMAYQSGRRVEEQYDDMSTGINTGITNSARGEGTTTSELVVKFRFYNCAVCLVIILLHTIPMIFNPFRLMHLITSPIQFLLELCMAILTLSLFLIEARIPILGEKVLLLFRDLAGGRINQFMDLNVARGRMLALIIMGATFSLLNYMSINGVKDVSSSKIMNDGLLIPDCVYAGTCNITTTTNMTANITSFSPGIGPVIFSDDDAHRKSLLLAILQSTLFSPSVLVVFGLAAYTLHVMHIDPQFEKVKSYEIDDGNVRNTIPNITIPSLRDFARPSWVADALGSSNNGGGYQTILTV